MLFTCINIEMHRFFGGKTFTTSFLIQMDTKTNKLTYMETVKNNSDFKKNTLNVSKVQR